MTHRDPDGGREWRPYELATPLTREPNDAVPPPLARTPVAGMHRPLPERATGDVVLAGPGARLGAAAIDIALWSLPLAFIFRAAMQAYHLQSLGLPVSMSGVVSKSVVALLLWGVVALWNLAWLAMHAQTIGKRFVGIRIVRSDGSPAGLLRLVLLRGALIGVLGNLLGRLLAIASPALWLADVLFIFGPNRQTLHDRIADTIVVDA